MVNTATSTVVDTIFKGDGTLSKKTSAHLAPTGEFVVDLTMITGFSMTEMAMVLWTAPNTEGSRGSYGRRVRFHLHPTVAVCVCACE